MLIPSLAYIGWTLPPPISFIYVRATRCHFVISFLRLNFPDFRLIFDFYIYHSSQAVCCSDGKHCCYTGMTCIQNGTEMACGWTKPSNMNFTEKEGLPLSKPFYIIT